jgi:hypothetical protein
MTLKPWAFMGVMGLIALGVMTPLKFGLSLARLEALGVSINSVEGSLWGGNIKGVQLRGKNLGDMRASVNPFAFLVGRAELKLKGKGPIAQAILIPGWGIKDLKGEVPIGLVVPDLGLQGGLSVQNVTVLFDKKQQCQAAKGEVVTEAFVAMGGPRLKGELSCQGAYLFIGLKGDNAQAKISAQFKLSAKGQYQLGVKVDSQSSDMTAALAMAGFNPDAQGQMVLSRTGG